MLWTPGAKAPYCLALLKKLDCQHSCDGRLFETRYAVVPCISSDVLLQTTSSTFYARKNVKVLWCSGVIL